MRKPDHLNNVVLPLIGAALLFWLWYQGYIPFKVIKAFLTEGI